MRFSTKSPGRWLSRLTVRRKRQRARCRGLDCRVAPARVPWTIARKPSLDQRLGQVLAVRVTVAHPAAMGSLAGEVAHHRLPLDHLDHERFSLEPSGLARISKCATSGAATPLRRTAIPPTLIVSPSVTRARPASRSLAADGNAAARQAKMLKRAAIFGSTAHIYPKQDGNSPVF